MFFDTHLAANAMIVLTVIVCAISFFKSWQVSLAIIVSLIGARYFTYTGELYYHSFLMLACGLLCLIKVDGLKLSLMDLEGSELNHAVSYIYSIRVLFDIPKIMGITGIEASWVVSMSLLLMQLILALGDGVGYGSRINSALSKLRSNTNALIFQR